MKYVTSLLDEKFGGNEPTGSEMSERTVYRFITVLTVIRLQAIL